MGWTPCREKYHNSVRSHLTSFTVVLYPGIFFIWLVSTRRKHSSSFLFGVHKGTACIAHKHQESSDAYTKMLSHRDHRLKKVERFRAMETGHLHELLMWHSEHTICIKNFTIFQGLFCWKWGSQTVVPLSEQSNGCTTEEPIDQFISGITAQL